MSNNKPQEFADLLKSQGRFVRDYEVHFNPDLKEWEANEVGWYKAADFFWRQFCEYDTRNIEGIKDMTMGELVSTYVKVRGGRDPFEGV